MATQVTLNSGSVDSAGSLALKTNGTTTAVTVDTSQNMGIGTSSPVTLKSATTLQVFGNIKAGNANGAGLISLGDTASTGANAGIWRGAAGAYGSSGNYLNLGGYDGITFTTGNVDIASQTERMRIDSSGNLLVGTTNPDAKLAVRGAGNSTPLISAIGNVAGDLAIPSVQLIKTDNNSTTSQIFQKFYINAGASGQGQINANGASAAAFGSFSDRRLKENIVDLPSQLANIMALRTVEFDYIESEGGGHQIGFVAQEVQEIYPDLVGEREDGMLTLTDLNKNDARLIKAIQEMKELIDTQANTIQSLTTRLTALENK